MSQQGKKSQAEDSGAQDAPPPVQIQPQEAYRAQENIPLIEEIDSRNIYLPHPHQAPSSHSDESSADAIQPPEHHWVLQLLLWLLRHLWALTWALATGAQQMVCFKSVNVDDVLQFLQMDNLLDPLYKNVFQRHTDEYLDVVVFPAELTHVTLGDKIEVSFPGSNLAFIERSIIEGKQRRKNGANPKIDYDPRINKKLISMIYDCFRLLLRLLGSYLRSTTRSQQEQRQVELGCLPM